MLSIACHFIFVPLVSVSVLKQINRMKRNLWIAMVFTLFALVHPLPQGEFGADQSNEIDDVVQGSGFGDVQENEIEGIDDGSTAIEDQDFDWGDYSGELFLEGPSSTTSKTTTKFTTTTEATSTAAVVPSSSITSTESVASMPSTQIVTGPTRPTRSTTTTTTTKAPPFRPLRPNRPLASMVHATMQTIEQVVTTAGALAVSFFGSVAPIPFRGSQTQQFYANDAKILNNHNRSIR